ncbi:peptidoglycan-binding protein [Oerskovia paurometabola]|uniref:Peptidoglycan-binding protein n=1 Tax=Oerskovia paurometabola TaxID=162170 RepID=A0ABW1X459_9CELL|nr:peptidoglycan-binding protein [Oerskovia paurometabola]MBM7498561.1 peptidoglycan hydrolase-like protein with peptidoglycan-binding domain [Oerskovia paurometabola]
MSRRSAVPGAPAPKRRRGLVVGGIVGTVVIGAGIVLALTGFGRGDVPAPAATGPEETATVTRQTLVQRSTVKGTLGHGEAVARGYQGAGGADGGGTVTWLPGVGDVVDRGGVLFKVDERPTVLLLGTLPVYRELGTGAEGEDVRQLEENLKALGYTGFTVDTKFTGSTAQAVTKWQKDRGVEKTGTVGPSDVLVAEGPVRVDALKVRVGDAAAAEILTTTGVDRAISVDLDISDRDRAVEGGTVTVELPGGATTEAVVSAVGSPEVVEDESGMPGASDKTTVPVTVTLPDGTDADPGSVKVTFVAAERPDVLTVPVAALLALAEGGYGVEVVEDGTSRIVAVETGMFADGSVEITGDVVEGDVVGMPS